MHNPLASPPTRSLLECKAVFVAALGLVVLIALGLRLPDLGRRPLHLDESVQAYKAGTLYDTGHYRYNPREFHGPSLYYATLPALWLSGAARSAEAGPAVYRTVAVVFGVGLILLGLLQRPGVGSGAALATALLTAVSPAFTYYSRFYIQEMILVFLTFLLILAGWHHGNSRKGYWAVVIGLTLGLLHATKETWVLSVGMMLLALWGAARWSRAAGEPVEPVRRWIRPWHAALAGLVALIVSWLLYSAFLQAQGGFTDSFRAFYYYFHRAVSGEGSTSIHRHPWTYYLRLLLFARFGPGPWWSEALIFALGLTGIVVVAFGHTLSGGRRLAGMHLPLLRFLLLYTAGLTALYCAIPYKTPWNLLSFYHGFLLMAGVGAVMLFRMLPARWMRGALAVVLLAGVAQLAAQAWRASHRFEVDGRNPYVYAHTSNDLLRLVARVEELAALHPDGKTLLIRIESNDYWPLPFYLREYERVGYFQGDELKALDQAIDAPIVITRPEDEDRLENRLQGEYQKEYYGLRPEVPLAVYIRGDLWDRLMQTKSAAP